MYNKLFSKILRSSVWLLDSHVRLVWVTLLAAMDKDGYAQFSTVGNLAEAARVSKEQAQEAVNILESPEPETAYDEFAGRRIERVPGGWMVLKAPEYNTLATHELEKQQTRERVAKFRASKKEEKLPKEEKTTSTVTPPTPTEGNALKRECNGTGRYTSVTKPFNATEAAMGYCHKFSIVGQPSYDLIRQAIEICKGDPQTVANEMIAAREKYEALSGKKFEYEPLNFIVKGVWKYPQRWLGKPKQKSLEEIIEESINGK